MKVKTTKIKEGVEYAKVADRLKLFWEENPRGKISTTPTIQGTYVMFTTEIISDQSKEFSKKSTGSAMEKLDKAKSFEKTESISVGRALALLGYLASGEVASSEEMEEFYNEKEKREIEEMEILEEKLAKCATKQQARDLYKEYEGKGKEFADKIMARGKELSE